MKKALEKNVDPAVMAYMNAVVDDINKLLDKLKAEAAENKKQLTAIKREVAKLSKSADDTANNIAAIEIKASKQIQKALANRDTDDQSVKEQTQEIVEAVEARISVFEESVSDLNHKVTRYFDKEKYAITKGLITQIIKEEKVNG
jgi:predicted  nucleic acid-binding Zn-ribbon protein